MILRRDDPFEAADEVQSCLPVGSSGTGIRVIYEMNEIKCGPASAYCPPQALNIERNLPLQPSTFEWQAHGREPIFAADLPMTRTRQPRLPIIGEQAVPPIYPVAPMTSTGSDFMAM